MSAGVWIAVGVGGAVGSMARYGVGLGARAFRPDWPWGTLAVNIVGSFLIGLLFAWFLVRPAPDWVRVGMITGVLGGFTTFSAFSIETLELVRAGSISSALLYVGLTLIVGLAACALGMLSARLLLA